MAVFEVISTVSHKSLMNKTKHDLATWIMHLLDCRDESERARVQRVTDLLEANNRYQQDAREAREAYRRLIATDENDDEALPRYTTRRLRQEIERQTAELRAERDAALNFQGRVDPWLIECFGETIARDRTERSHRFLEESLETVQAAGTTRSEAHQLVDYVFDRPVGDLPQEVGGVMVTLAALCLAHGIYMREAGEIELERVWTKVEQIRAKQAAKPKHSPLPEETPGPGGSDHG